MMRSEEVDGRKKARKRDKNLWKLESDRIIYCGLFLYIEVFMGTSAVEVCSTHECTTIARRIALNMNLTADACDDMYEFACGSFHRATSIPKRQDSTCTDDRLSSDVHYEIKRMITAEIKSDEPKPFRILKTLYKTCMDPRNYGNLAKEDLKNFLKKKGGWPVVEGSSWHDRGFTWRQKIRKFTHDADKLGDFSGIRIDPNPKKKRLRMITLFVPTTKFPSSTKTKDFKHPNVQGYYNFVVDVAVELGADRAYALAELKESILFDLKRKEIELTKEEIAKSKSPNIMTIKELNIKYPSVPWVENIKSILTSPDINISEDEIINVPVPEYFVRLEDLMSKTPTKVQANSVMSRIVLRNAVYSSEQIRYMVEDYLGKVSGPIYMERENMCSTEVIGNLWSIFNSMFIRKYIRATAARDVDKMIKAIKEEYINRVNWIMPYYAAHEDEDIVKTMKMAVDAVNYVLYPQDEASLEAYYEHLNFDDASFFKNMERMSEFDADKQYWQLRQPSEFQYLAQYFAANGVNPVQIARTPFLPIPKSFIQILYASDNLPKALGFATIGMNAAREIISSSYIGTANDTCNCNECIIEKWNNYPIDGKKFKLSGTRTLVQNKIDIGSLRVAYNAYITWLTKHDDTVKLSGFEEYTPEQMFWITAASSVCTKYTDESFRNLIKEGSIVPPKYQVNIVFSNMQEFMRDFGCASWTRMRAKTTCDVW